MNDIRKLDQQENMRCFEVLVNTSAPSPCCHPLLLYRISPLPDRRNGKASRYDTIIGYIVANYSLSPLSGFTIDTIDQLTGTNLAVTRRTSLLLDSRVRGCYTMRVTLLTQDPRLYPRLRKLIRR